MEVWYYAIALFWYYAIALFLTGYMAGVIVEAARSSLARQIATKRVRRRCNTCRYCYDISKETRSLLHPDNANKSLCIMWRGTLVPAGCDEFKVSVVDDCSFCDQWKERDPDG